MNTILVRSALTSAEPERDPVKDLVLDTDFVTASVVLEYKFSARCCHVTSF